MKPQSSARLRSLIPVWLCVFGLLYATTAHAQGLSPEVSRGLSWLQGQVRLDGTLANEASSIATPLQNRSETAQTLKTLSTLPASLSDAIAGETEGNTEYLARRIVALALAGRDVSALVTALSAHQNLDGGFGGGAGYDSNALDTAWALVALKSANAIAPVSPALAYLVSTQATDGSYSAPGRPDIETTAIAVLALRAYASEFSTIAQIQRAVTYLLSQQSPTQQWSDSPFLTATAYEAIHDFVSLEPTASAVKTYLISRQAAEGSWDSGDPFSTALALRALVLAATAPANPTLAIVKGKVIDSQTGLPLDGVIAALTGPTIPAPATTSAGVFEFRDLTSGTYGLQLTLSQYGTITTTTSISAGQTLNLGVLQMSKVQGATTGTVRGTVRDSATSQPIEGALLSVSGGLSALSDGAGNYQVVNVPPGTITVQASKSGYATAGGTGSLSAGGVFVFSPSLVPGSQSGAGATLLGTVNRATDGAPLAGVSITVSGATSASAVTDAQGSYRISGLNPGVTQVSAVLAGFDSVSAATNVVANATVNFSPVLFPTNTSPPNGNKASVTGVVMDSGTNAVLPGVSVSATFGTTTVQAQTGADGRFKFEGITTATVDLSFSLSGYQGSSVSVPLEVLQALDVGQVRLRRSQVTQLLPDLAAKSLTRAGATTDPQTLAVSGQITAIITNLGTANAPAGVQVIAFHDANRNGVYDPGQDTLLGQTSLDFELAPGAETPLLVPVSGQLPFRDAPIHIWLDSTQSVVEQNETNNIASTAAAAQAHPSIGTFQPVLKWAWTGSGSVLPEHNQVMSIPVVAPIEDTNGDGKIDQNDIPGVIFHTFVGSNIFADGVLRAVSGRDGHELWTVTNSAFRTNPGGHLAVADLDGDGIVEIIAPKSGGGVIVFGHDGTFKWQSPVPANNINSGGLAVADLDGDGVPEIIFGNTVLNANGTLRWQGTGTVGSISAVADLDLDGIPEIIAGSAAYRNNGQLYWQNNNVAGPGGLYVAVGNLDADPFPEIVVVNNGRVWVLEHDGTIKWGPVLIPGGGFGGPPTIADMDGDGVPEIGVAGASRYVALRADGSILWTSPTRDFSSSSTGSSVFDFDGDGTAEVVYADEQFLRVYNGKTGAVVFSTPNSNGTLTELPVVVDVDGDNHADIIVSANQLGIAPFGQAGIRVFQDQNNSWVNTRRIWNQHTYHVTNINDNGTVPRIEQNSWQVHNTYRLNKRLDISATAVADLTASYLRVQDRGGAQPSTFTVRVGNGGSLGADAGVRVAFYKGQPGAGGVLLGVGQTTQALDQGVYEDVSISFAQSLAGISSLVAVVDDDGTGKSKVTDFDRTNNSASLALAALPGSFSIQVVTDQPSYRANTEVAINASVANAGSFDGTATARFTIETADGMAAVTTLSPLVTLDVPHGTSRPALSSWNTGTVFVGNYRVKAELVDGAGVPYAAAFAPFAITTDTNTLLSARVTANKLAYLPAETAQLTSRVINLTENQPLDSVTAVTTVTNPDGTVRFTQSELIPQLVPGALKDFNYAVPLGFAAAGSYAATLSVRGALGAVVASGSTSFTVGSSAVSGSGLTGALSATPKPVPFGDPIALTAAVNNLGNADIPALNVKIAVVDPAAQQVLAEFPATLALARGQTVPLSFGWPATAPVGGTYVAVLSATVGTATLTLAQEAFTIVPPLTRVAGTLVVIPKQVPQGEAVALSARVTNAGFGAIAGLPISVTVANSATQQVVAQFSDIASIALSGAYQKAFSWPATGAVGTSYTATLRATVSGAAQTLAQDSFSIIAPPVQLDVNLASLKQARVLVLLSCTLGADGQPRSQAERDACVAQRGAFLASYLTSLGMNYRITATEADFQLAFRSGQYNTYWVTGGSLKLANTLTEEVREAVYRGDALILDDVHDERNHGLDAPAGVDLQGKLAATDQAVSVTGPLFAAGTLASLGRPLQLVLTTGAVQAVFPASANGPAIVTNQYGLGRGIVFAYDLVGTLMAQASGGLTELVQAGIAWVAPEPAAVSMARAYTVLRARVTNLGIGANLKATFTAPAGASVLGTAPAAVPDASGRPTWSFTLDSGATQNLDVGLRLPATTGSLSASLSVDLNTGLPSPFSSFATLAVESAETVAPRVAGELSALEVASNDKLDRNAAVSNILAAQASIAAGAYEQAIGQLLTAAERLLKITSVDMSAHRVQVDRLLQEAQVRWALAQPVSP